MLKKMTWLLPAVAILVLLPALTGPVLLDDSIHLGPIIEWLSNRTNTFTLIFGNTSGPFGRPVSISSFVLNALTTGAQIWPMKLSNLLLHLVTGLCIAKLFFRLFKRDANLLEHAKVASIVAASLWLVLPQHISTVFYLIQRMTILATLFALLACWLYVVARERIERKQKNGVPLLFGVVALFTLSVLSKESGLLIPLYCLLIELVYFQPSTDNPRPKIIAWGFRLGVIYPFVLFVAYLAFNPAFVIAPFIDRPFSMPERAMTQISVMADYFASTFLPMVRSAGVFNDDFPIAHSFGLRELLISLAGLGLITAAIRFRKSYPSFSAGVGLFFIGHLLESSIFSLEIYFSHRNYLPSIGLVLATWGLIAGFLHRHKAATESFKYMLTLAYAGLFIAYSIASFNRASLWSDNGALMSHAQIHHPTSSRMRSELLLAALYSKRLDLALQQADIALQTSPANEKRGIQLWRILAYCYVRAPIPSHELQAFNSMPADRITLATNTALIYVSAAAEANACPGLDRKQLGILSSQWAINTVQPPYSQWVWKTHLASARLLASGGDLEAGFKQAQWAFKDSGYQFHAGVLAYQLANTLDDRKLADEVLLKLKANQSSYTDVQKNQLGQLGNR